jgi:integrase
MSIYKCKNNWKAEVWIDNKRMTGKAGFTSKAEAKDWHDRALLDFRGNANQYLKPKSQLFEELLEKYEANHLPTISVETRRRYRSDIDYRIKDYFRYRPLDSITPMLVESFRGKIMKELEPKSVNNCTNLLSAIFRKGEEWGMIDKNPVRIRALRISDQKYSWWDKKEHVTQFLKEAKKTHYYAAYKLALECGMRLGEIIGLSKHDVSFERNQIHIHRQWLNREECYGPTKGRRERFVYFDPKSDLKDALKQAIEESSHKEAIFVSKEGVRMRPRRFAARHFQRIVVKAEVPRIRFHDLRHTFASWYMIEVGDIWTLKSILGHVDVQTTQRYAHLSDKHQQKPTLHWIA